MVGGYDGAASSAGSDPWVHTPTPPAAWRPARCTNHRSVTRWFGQPGGSSALVPYLCRQAVVGVHLPLGPPRGATRVKDEGCSSTPCGGGRPPPPTLPPSTCDMLHRVFSGWQPQSRCYLDLARKQ